MARILLIDDEALTRRTLQLALENAGHSVATAEDADTGLALARTLGFDVVVTDIVMPGRDGLDAIVQLRRERPNLRLVAISGSGHAGKVDVLRLARDLGADRTLEKPFLSGSLIAAVKDCLDRPAAA